MLRFRMPGSDAPPHRMVLALGGALLVLAALAAAGEWLLPGRWDAPVAVLVLSGALLLVAGFALRPRSIETPPAPVEASWFGASTDFAGSALAPETVIDASGQPTPPATRWTAAVFDAIEWKRTQAVCEALGVRMPPAHDGGVADADRTRLLALIALRPPAEQQRLLAVAYEGEYWRPSCPACGQKMVERSGSRQRRPAWTCADAPRCRFTLAVRQAGD